MSFPLWFVWLIMFLYLPVSIFPNAPIVILYLWWIFLAAVVIYFGLSALKGMWAGLKNLFR